MRTATSETAGLTYLVKMYEHLDKDFIRITLHCIGYGTNEFQPDEWNLYFKVPVGQIDRWPLGKMVRLSFNVQ